MNGNLPAYPTIAFEGHHGLSKRELFAMAAMQGLVMGTCGVNKLWDEFTAYATGPCNQGIASRAVAMADALLAELAKGGGE